MTDTRVNKEENINEHTTYRFDGVEDVANLELDKETHQQQIEITAVTSQHNLGIIEIVIRVLEVMAHLQPRELQLPKILKKHGMGLGELSRN